MFLILGENDTSASNEASQKFIDNLPNIRNKQSKMLRGDDTDHFMLNWEASWQLVEN